MHTKSWPTCRLRLAHLNPVVVFPAVCHRAENRHKTHGFRSKKCAICIFCTCSESVNLSGVTALRANNYATCRVGNVATAMRRDAYCDMLDIRCTNVRLVLVSSVVDCAAAETAMIGISSVTKQGRRRRRADAQLRGNKCMAAGDYRV